MATMSLAMWFQQQPDYSFDRHLIIIFIGLITVAIAGLAIIGMVIAIKAAKAVKEITATADEFKVKLLPLLDSAMEISKSTSSLLQDVSPKIKSITEHLEKTTATLAETSQIAKTSAQRVEVTITDVNLRAQKQVARVDGMVSAALTTTSEVVETINQGIRVPAQKIAVMATQAKFVAEGLLAKFKSMAANSPFASRRPAPYEPHDTEF